MLWPIKTWASVVDTTEMKTVAKTDFGVLYH